MKHFIDKINSMTRHTFSAASVVDSAGNQAGKVLIRYTDSQIGYNHEVGAVIYSEGIDFATTYKGSCYGQPETLYRLFKDHGFTCYDYDKRRIYDYNTRPDKDANIIESMSGFNQIKYIKHGRKQYRLDWVLA